MNNFGERLDNLAGRASRGVKLNDPSLAVATPRAPQKRVLAVGFAGVLVIAAMLFAWQGIDRDSTSLVTAQDPGDYQSQGQADCASGELLSTLRAGMATSDYQPAGSYADLRDSSLVVVAGSLATVENAIVNGLGYVELTPDQVVHHGRERHEVDVIAFNWKWANRSQPNPLAEPIDLTGVRFVAFLNPWSGVRGGWAPGPEGLYLACDESAPLVAVANDAAGPGDPTGMSIAELTELLAGAEETPLQDEVDEQEEQRRAEEAAIATAEQARIIAEEQARIIAEQQAAIDAVREAPADLAAARALWTAAGVVDYQFDYKVFAAQGQGASLTVTVENGEAASADIFQAGTESTPLWSVDDLFDIIDSAAIVREVTFDPVLGYPTLLNVDPDDSVAGDELRVQVGELFALADIDSAATGLATWLPDPIDPGPLTNQLAPAIGPDRQIDTVYELHTHPTMDVFLLAEQDNICIQVARRDNPNASEAYSGGSGSCLSTTNFALKGAWLSTGGGGDRSAALVVVPPIKYRSESWSIEVDTETSFEIQQTDRSAVIVFDVDSPTEIGSATLRCGCGDIAYSFQID